SEAYHIEKGREYDKAIYAKDREELEREIAALKGIESSTQINKDSVMLSAKHETSNLYASKDVLAMPQHDKGLNQYDNTKETFTDSYGKTHEIPKDIAQAWKNTFNLQSLDEAYIPNFTPEVKQALDFVLQGEDIKLYAGSLVKLMQRDRLEFLPYIKDTLEHSDIVIKDKENAIIFAKDIGQTSYFTSVSKNDKGEWVISTNSYKTLSQLKNRVNDNGEILYISKEAPNILAETFTTKAFSNELANAIIPQTPQEIIKQAKQSGKSVKETKELIDKNKE
ncbi:PBECR2 nuclease fold domain-containing protein, partial [Helicobacter bilis]|uniref:PBECR2 nuclease fold domain-containing protein n=1 Tax=Helicobacter bilis TaxID=37372 RepID=UPI0023AA5ABF